MTADTIAYRHSSVRTAMTKREAFYSIHRQGFVRVAAGTPRIALADPAANADAMLAMVRDGDRRAVDPMYSPNSVLARTLSMISCCGMRCSMPSRLLLDGSWTSRVRCILRAYQPHAARH